MILDIVVLVVLLISAGIAFMRGFIREVLTIAGVGGGFGRGVVWRAVVGAGDEWVVGR